MPGEDFVGEHWSQTPEFADWARVVQSELLPKLQDSCVTANLLPAPGTTDVKYAVELGFTIMMDKPLMVLARPGYEVPAKLRLVADEIVEVDFDDQVSLAAASERIQAFADRHGGPE